MGVELRCERGVVAGNGDGCIVVAVGGTLGSVAVSGTLGSVRVGGTLGSVADRCGSVL